jgi:hypothetical protein
MTKSNEVKILKLRYSITVFLPIVGKADSMTTYEFPKDVVPHIPLIGETWLDDRQAGKPRTWKITGINHSIYLNDYNGYTHSISIHTS